MKFNIEDYREYYNQYFKEFNRLAPPELSYGNDKPNDTASSLEACIAYANYIVSNYNNNLDILNAGAGASSWMFRELFNRVMGNGVVVICADPDIRYLNLVKQVCGKLRGGPYHHGLDWGNQTEPFTHIFYDYGDIERLPYLGHAIDMTYKSLYIDDADDRACCAPFRDIVIRLCEKKGLKWFDIEESRDEYGRRGLIIEK